jgi:hypothetical protein
LLQAIAVVIALMFISGGTVKLWAFVQRRRRAAVIADPVMVERGVSMRIELHGARLLRGLDPRRAHLTHADMVLGADRFVIAANRGTVADVGSKGGSFSSVRSTGPARLVIEGVIPVANGPDGLYRFEIVVADATRWVELLSPFVVETEESRRFGTFGA